MKASDYTVNIIDLDDRMIEFANKLEEELGYELIITSGYRSPEHPIEAGKAKPGEHTTGLAIDVASIGGTPTFNLVAAAIELGCKRIGVSRKNNFVHLGLDQNTLSLIHI